jgi:hypothetical protein
LPEIVADTEIELIARNTNMAEDQTDASPRAKSKPRSKTKSSERGQSTIQFPYMDLDAAISVARAMLQAGGVGLTRDQLAGVMKLAAGSGNFVTKVATARIFGLIATEAGKYELTDLGFSILDSDEKRQKGARAESFLSVPLYRKVYDEFRGRQLPPRPLGLEQALVKFGVAPKQKTNARLAFDKSAQQAGFFAAGNDRLIEPIIAGGAARPTTYADEIDFRGEEKEKSAVVENPFDRLGRHPFIQGLLETLPEPNTNWSIEGRAKWLQAAAHVFDLIYKGSGEINITAKGEPLSKEQAPRD